MWWGTGRVRFALPGASVTKGQISRGQDIPGRGNSMCAGINAYQKERCGMPECPNITGSDRQRGCQRPQGWYFHPASCSGLSCSSLQASRTYSVQSTVPGIGPECGIEAGAWVREKDFGIGYRDKDLCGWCYSGGEGEAPGKNSRKRIMGELEALQILAIHPWTGRFSGCRKGREGSACVWRVLFLLHLHLEI